MTPEQEWRRFKARQILMHLMSHEYLDNSRLLVGEDRVASALEQAGVIKMKPNLIDWIIGDLEMARFLLYGEMPHA